MLQELTSPHKVIGVKQSRKVLTEEHAEKAFFALDADPLLLEPLRALCAARDIPVDDAHTMAELGRACKISVGAAVAVLLRKE